MREVRYGSFHDPKTGEQPAESRRDPVVATLDGHGTRTAMDKHSDVQALVDRLLAAWETGAREPREVF